MNLVHDEIVLEIDEEHAQAGKAWLERCMVDGMNEMAGADIPMSVEIYIGENWADKGRIATAASVLSEATEPRAQAHPQLPGPASSDNGDNLAKEGLTATGYYEDDEPVRINLYLDYRDGTLDNFPTIALCDECAEDLGGDAGELTELEAGQAAVCEMCGRGNAAMLHQIL